MKLTAAGYLPPALVRETVDVLGLNDHWNASTNREHHMPEVLHFRDSAQHLGLLRKANGRLLLTRAGTRARTDPDLLWRHMVTVLPVATTSRGPEAECGRLAGTLFLLAGRRTTQTGRGRNSCAKACPPPGGGTEAGTR